MLLGETSRDGVAVAGSAETASGCSMDIGVGSLTLSGVGCARGTGGSESENRSESKKHEILTKPHEHEQTIRFRRE